MKICIRSTKKGYNQASKKELGVKSLLKQAENSHILTTVLEPEDPSYDFDKMHDLLYEKGFTIYPEKNRNEANFQDCEYMCHRLP